MNQLMQAIKIGINLESESIKLYTESIDKITDQEGKELLQFLVNQEKKHLEFLTKQIESLKKKKELVDIAKLEASSISFEVEPVKILPKKSDFKQNMNDFHVLELAMATEKRGIENFSSAKKDANQEDAKKMFEILENEEKKHLALLEKEMEHIASLGQWFDYREIFTEE